MTASIFRFAATICIGLLIGWLQWIVLQKYFEVDSLWVWASTLTYGVFLFVIILIDYISLSTMLLVEISVLSVLGLPQRSVLKYYLHHPSTWILLSPVAAMIGTLVSWKISDFLFPSGNPAMYWALFGLMYGSVTGVSLIIFEARASN
ncbi:MAG: hypothetical protein ACOYYS_09950 [Chloroflexota bacterium]